MVLSDGEIWDALSHTSFNIEPLTTNQVQPASVDLRLGGNFKRMLPTGNVIDTREGMEEKFTEWNAEYVDVHPDDFILGTTVETVNLPPDIYGEIKGRSSVGRLGIEVHKTAGVCDPGYRGELTLEITNDNPDPVRLYKGQRICQITLTKMDEPANNPYGEKDDTKYQGQHGATTSRLNEDK